jgi:phosphoribosylformylglycinamidine synthase subunit PurSL
MRIELFNRPSLTDGRAQRLFHGFSKNFGLTLDRAVIVDVYLVHGAAGLAAREIEEAFVDHVAQDYRLDRFAAADFPGWHYLVETAYRPGVTDPVAATAREALENLLGRKLDAGARVQSARQYLFFCGALDRAAQEHVFSSLYNPLIETALVLDRAAWDKGQRPPADYAGVATHQPAAVAAFDLDAMDDEALSACSKEKLLALTLAEMRVIQGHFRDREFLAARAAAGLTNRITDVEIEMIAQTWSEHCKHKIFNAEIAYRDGDHVEIIRSIFKTYVKKTTDIAALKKKYLLSVFEDDSGVIRFDRDHALCFKVETHNSPSALDPYGGAITGIVGVNRDILATGRLATPIFNTNVLCFADPATSEDDVPPGLLHPRRVLEGVHRGIVDGGNQSGIPVVGGAFLFDPDYMGKPLVFCGTGGLLPAKIAGEPGWIKHVDPDDLAVMVGGRIGKDGIHGATFSSLALDESSPTSAVQIGDPITQRKMWDFLEEARGLCLFRGLTDNGAGGLSSSLGEMAKRSGGVEIDLDRCPLKYPGLAPWEILVSESQERMSIAVKEDRIHEFLALAGKRAVEATVVGRFTADGFIRLRDRGKVVGLISLAFLHDGLPRLKLKAEWNPPPRTERVGAYESIENLLQKALADPNVSSREALVRQYDHEVRGGSIVKPFTGPFADGPSDGAVYKPVFGSWRGFTVTHGVCPRFSAFDGYHMAANAVDEAFRAHIALGGDPEYAAALDNFCWPDPVAGPNNPDGEHKLAQLVRTGKGLHETCLAYGLPLISGKDSMKNDAFTPARNGKPARKISIKPTLLVSLIGIVRDVRRALTTDFKEAGDAVYVLGETANECGGSILEIITGNTYRECPTVDACQAMKLYRALARAIGKGLVRSCHDCSEGGLAVALAESALAGRTGLTVNLDRVPLKGGPITSQAAAFADAELLFSESASRFVASVSPKHEKRFQALFRGLPVARIGVVTADDVLIAERNGKRILALETGPALAAFQGRLA